MPIEEVNRTFGPWDYVVFASLFLIPSLIGVFFAVKAKRSNANTDDYLMGGRKLHAVPVAFSLTSGFLSAISILGWPTEYYLYGTMFLYFAVSYFIAVTIASEIYIPLLYNLGITSTYEYLELRFNRATRYTACTIYILNQIVYLGIVIYAPAIALNGVTGLNIWISIAVSGGVCTFYTALGGIKAVVWTHVFLYGVMVTGSLVIIIKGSLVMGGYQNIWNISDSRGRIDFVHFEGDPRIRHTFWSVIIGGTMLWTYAYCTTQTVVQRILSCKSINHARTAMYLTSVGGSIISILSALVGLTMFAYYADCDPYKAGWVSKTDELVPYFVMELLSDIPGLSGIFVSSAFSGTLSTVSSGINAMATVTLEDYIKPLKTLSPSNELLTSKILVVGYGCICIVMAVVASNLGSIYQAATSINGIVAGGMVGLFTMGATMPWINSWGAISGAVCGIAAAIWCFIGSTIYPPLDEFTRILDTSTEDCVFPLQNDSIPTTTFKATTTTYIDNRPPIAELYSISYFYYGVFGLIVALVVGNVVSLLTGFQKPSELPPGVTIALFDHPVFCWLPKKVRRFLWCGVNYEQPSDTIDKKYDDFREKGGIGNVSFIVSGNEVNNNEEIGEDVVTKL